MREKRQEIEQEIERKRVQARKLRETSEQRQSANRNAIQEKRFEAYKDIKIESANMDEQARKQKEQQA